MDKNKKERQSVKAYRITQEAGTVRTKELGYKLLQGRGQKREKRPR